MESGREGLFEGGQLLLAKADAVDKFSSANLQRRFHAHKVLKVSGRLFVQNFSEQLGQLGAALVDAVLQVFGLGQLRRQLLPLGQQRILNTFELI